MCAWVDVFQVALCPHLLGTSVSVETTHDLLDLLCLYCDREPAQEGGPQQEDTVRLIRSVILEEFSLILI